MNTVISGSTVTFAAHDRGQTSMPINSTCGPFEFKAPVKFDKGMELNSDVEVKGDLLITGKTTFKGDVVLPLPPSLGIKLEELEDLVVEEPKNNDVIRYNEGTSKWVSQHIHDPNATGFEAWETPEDPPFIFVGTQLKIQGGSGYICGKRIVWEAATLEVVPEDDAQYIHVKSDLSVTKILYSDVTEETCTTTVPLFIFDQYSNNGTYSIVKANYSYQIPATVRNIFRTIQSPVIRQGGEIYHSGGETTRTVGIYPGVLEDYGLNTTIQSNAGVTWAFLYKNAGDLWAKEITMNNNLPFAYNNSGTITDLTGFQRSLFWLGVMKDNGIADLPQYVAIYQPSVFTTLIDAVAAISSDVKTTLPSGELNALRIFHLGWAIVNNNGGSPRIESVISIRKSDVEGQNQSHLILRDINEGQYGDGGHKNLTVFSVHDQNPTPSDTNYKIGTIWHNTSNNHCFQLFQNSPTALWKIFAYGIPTHEDLADTIVLRNAEKAIHCSTVKVTTLTEIDPSTALTIDAPTRLELKIPGGMIMPNNSKIYLGSADPAKIFANLNTESISFGYGAGKAFDKSKKSIAIGQYALGRAATSSFDSYWNVAIGENSLYNFDGPSTADLGNENIGIGQSSMKGKGSTRYSASGCIGLGGSSMKNINCAEGERITGNIAIGTASLLDIKGNANYNTAIGHGAGKSITTGSNNVAVGKYAMNTGAAGTSDNVAVGVNAGNLFGTDSSHNIAIGSEAMNSATQKTVNNNIAIGRFAGSLIGANSTGNIVMGYHTMNHATSKTVTNCIAIGNECLQNIGTNATNVICIGENSGNSISHGAKNIICLGATGSGTFDGTICIGRELYNTLMLHPSIIPLDVDGEGNPINADYHLTYDSNSGIVYRGTGISSQRKIKQNIENINNSDSILQITPVSFQYKKRPTVNCFGFIVEDLVQIIPEAVHLETVGGNITPWSIKYENITALLVHFIQKLHARVVQLESGASATTTTATIVEDPSTLVETKLEPTVVQPISNNVISIPQLTTEEAKNQLKTVPGDCTINFRKPGTKSKVYWIGTKLDGLYYEREIDMISGVPI